MSVREIVNRLPPALPLSACHSVHSFLPRLIHARLAIIIQTETLQSTRGDGDRLEVSLAVEQSPVGLDTAVDPAG